MKTSSNVHQYIDHLLRAILRKTPKYTELTDQEQVPHISHSQNAEVRYDVSQ